MKSNLRKAPKWSYLALHPGNNKQIVPLALVVIHKTMITAAQRYFPNRQDISNFLEIFSFLWTISNSKGKVSPYKFGNDVINANKKNWVFKSSGRLDYKQ